MEEDKIGKAKIAGLCATASAVSVSFFLDELLCFYRSYY